MFNSDRPIETAEEDILKRTYFAEKLAFSIKEIHQNESVVIGLQGSWGSGKTSVLNIAKHKLGSVSESNTIVITFNPWNSLNKTSLPLEFFRTLMAGLCRSVGKTQYKGSSLKNLAKALDDYSQALSGGGRALAKMASRSLKDKADEHLDSIEERKARVSKILKKAGIKILVAIDDIDRLSNDQICSVFQTVATIADFPNVNYLLAYDKQIVSGALSHIQGSSGDKYLEKIIQIEINIPDIQQSTIMKALRKELAITTDYLPDKEEDENFNAQLDDLARGISCYASNLRDAKKYLNILRFELNYFAEKVHPFDIAAMTALKMFDLSVFRAAKENDELLCGPSPVSNNQARKTREEFLAFSENNQEGAEILLSSIFPIMAIGHNAYIANLSPNDLIKRKSLAHHPIFVEYFFENAEQDSTEFNIDEILFNCRLEDIETSIRELAAEGSLVDFSVELQSHKRRLDANRANAIARSLLNNMWRSRDSDGMFSERRLVTLAAIEAFSLSNLADSSSAVKESIANLEGREITALAHFIIEQERANGRYGFSGAKQQPVITMETLQSLEQKFNEAMESLAQTELLLKNYDSRTEFHLWRKVDSSACETYLRSIFKSSSQAAFGSQLFITIWHSKEGRGWAANKSFANYISPEEYQAAILKSSQTPDFWEADRFVSTCAAALYLCIKNEQHATGGATIDDDKVQALLDEWRSEFNKMMDLR